MSRRNKNSSAATPVVEPKPQEEVAIVSAPASDPSGMNGPDGTDTSASDGGDATGKASVDPANPHGDASSTVEGATSHNPEAEASTSGTSSAADKPQDGEGAASDAADTDAQSIAGSNPTDTPESDRTGGAGNTASPTAAPGEGRAAAVPSDGVSPVHISPEQLEEARKLFLGVPAQVERRRFIVVFGPVRHNNIRYRSGARIDLTEIEHAELRAKQIVGTWETGKPV